MDTGHRSRHSDRGAASGGLIFFGLVIAVVGAVIVYAGWSSAADARASKSWPTAQGTVLESRLQVVQNTDQDNSADSYNPVIAYRYTVDGTTYRSTQVAFGVHNSGSEGAVRNKVASYPVGNSVDVAYDPADHSRAVLEPGEEGMAFFIELAGSLMILVGLILIVSSFLLPVARRRRAGTPPAS